MDRISAGRQTLSQAVAASLLERIRSGMYAPGDRLPTEKVLMSQFGVGRNVAREAVQGLVAMGLIDVRPGRGAVVLERQTPRGGVDADTVAALLLDDTVDDLYEFRSVVEVEIARRAAERATEADLRDLRAQVKIFGERIEAGAPLVAADIEFHAAIARASHNAVYLRALDALQEMLAQARAMTENIQWVRTRTRADHEEIVEAIVARDPERAADAMRRHMELAVAAVRERRGERGRAAPRADPPKRSLTS